MAQPLVEQSPRSASQPWLHALNFALLFAATLLLYRSDADLGFLNLDDQTYVTDNPYIREASVTNVVHILTKPYNANYSPLHLLSYLADYQVGGLDAKIFHRSSNIWAGLAAGFVYLLGAFLTKSRLTGFFSGLLFAVHPAHVEAVAWISSRKDLVSVAFAIPGILAYFQYRRAQRHAKAWYGVSLILFACAVAGKLSVVVLPGMLFLSDLFLDKRKLGAALLDKIPFVLVAIFFGYQTLGAQPDTRTTTDLFRFGSAVFENIWLLTGFADYVIYRNPPDPSVPAWRFVAICAFGLAAYLVPLLLARRRAPLVSVLALWTLIPFIPSQVLGFLHPVTDRYLFFPSVAFCILVAWSVAALFGRFGRIGSIAGVVTLIMLSVNWSINTLDYLKEWSDPRSVWYGASRKSQDASVHLFLGIHYEDSADRLRQGGATGTTAQAASLQALSSAIVGRGPKSYAKENPGSPEPTTTDVHNTLLDLAWTEYERAAQAQRGILLPNLYFRRGKMLMERGLLARARVEFERAEREARAHSSADVRQELAVRCAFAFGVIAWREANYPEAMRLLKRTEELQLQYGGSWIPDVAQQKEKLAGLMARPSALTTAVPADSAPSPSLDDRPGWTSP